MADDNPDVRKEAFTPLFWSIYDGDDAILKMMLEALKSETDDLNLIYLFSFFQSKKGEGIREALMYMTQHHEDPSARERAEYTLECRDRWGINS